MPNYLCGSLIKHTRVNMGLTQNQLCELLNGGCSVSHLSRIERGDNLVEIHLFNNIMEKLGENPQKYYTVLKTEREFKLNKLKDEANTFVHQKKYDDAKKIIDKLEQEYIKDNKKRPNKFKEALDRQCIMSFRAMLIIGTNTESADTKDYLADAIKITITDFDIERITDYFLTQQEIEIINMLAVLYSRTECRLQAIDILCRLRDNIEKNYNDKLQKTTIFQLILYNLSKYLGLEKRYQEAVNICDTAIDCAIKFNKLRLIPKLLYNKAYGMFCLGDKQTTRILLTRCYYMHQGFNDFIAAERLKERSMKNFQMEIPE